MAARTRLPRIPWGSNLRVFAEALDELQEELANARSIEGPPSPGFLIAERALQLWDVDPGDKWGEGSFFFGFGNTDLVMSSPQYTIIPASQAKCNAFVAEAIFLATGKVLPGPRGTDGRHFPPTASDWANLGAAVPGFKLVRDQGKPQLGDIWSNGGHVGIFLAKHKGEILYISARETEFGERTPFGVHEGLQKTDGIHVKFLPRRVSSHGIYRRYAVQ